MLDFERIIHELGIPAAAPLHARLRQAIYAQIMDTTLKPGEALPPERIMQEQLGISRATVRQAIKTLVNDGLLKSVVGAGNFVLEPQIVASERPLVGIIIPESSYNVYYPELAAALATGLRDAGFRIDMSIHHDQSKTLSDVTSSLLAQHAAALVLVAPKQTESESVIRQLRARGVHVLLLTRYFEHLRDLDYVGADNRLIGYEATRHLLDLGHTSILHIAGSQSSTAVDRAVGYVDAMQAAGLTPQIFKAPDEPSALAAELQPYVLNTKLAQLWVRLVQHEITGIFCFNDQIASWVQKELRSLNLAIPRDLSLIAVDNMPYAEFFDSPLTTFALPGKEIGRTAAALLVRRLQGEEFPPQQILLPADFVLRLSTAAPPRPKSRLV